MIKRSFFVPLLAAAFIVAGAGSLLAADSMTAQEPNTSLRNDATTGINNSRAGMTTNDRNTRDYTNVNTNNRDNRGIMNTNDRNDRNDRGFMNNDRDNRGIMNTNDRNDRDNRGFMNNNRNDRDNRTYNNANTNDRDNRGIMDSAGQYLDDAGITAAVKAKFLTERGLDSLDISVETKENTVILSGQVDTNAQKSLAENVASQTDGVRNVDNKISVKN